MHMLPAMGHKSLLPNAIQETLGGTMKQNLRRCYRLKTQIDRNRMALTGSNPLPIFTEEIALFVIFRDDLTQHSQRER